MGGAFWGLLAGWLMLLLFRARRAPETGAGVGVGTPAADPGGALPRDGGVTVPRGDTGGGDAQWRDDGQAAQVTPR